MRTRWQPGRSGERGCSERHNVKTVRVGLHSLVLVMADIAGVGGGAVAAFQILGVPNQVWLQLPIAIGLSVILFSGWILALRALGFGRLQLVGGNEFGICLGLSVLWAPLVFVPLHYLTQGYLTSIGNLVALALYQVPVNALALLVSAVVQGTIRRKPQQTGLPANGP